MRDLDSLRQTGVMLTAPGEARVRADVVLLVGDGLLQTWPGLNQRLLRPPARPEGVDVSRRIIWLAPQADARIPGFAGDMEVIEAGRWRNTCRQSGRVARAGQRTSSRACADSFGLRSTRSLRN